jgi:hypothetical protein
LKAFLLDLPVSPGMARDWNGSSTYGATNVEQAQALPENLLLSVPLPAKIWRLF